MNALNRIAGIIDRFNEAVGRVVSWAALLIVLIEFIVVLLRYVFGEASIAMQESVVYLHGALFMLAAGYTLLHDGHVRVDVFLRDETPRTRALVDIAGVVVFLLPMCVLVGWMSWSYVADSWGIHEGSRETSGLQAVFLLKTAIPVFAVLLGLQGISMLAHAMTRLRTGRE